ncbi:MAG: DUF2188 domain-containing protein [Candidatus Coproplasma sp.]
MFWKIFWPVLGVLVIIALIVVIALVVKKNKKGKAQDANTGANDTDSEDTKEASVEPVFDEQEKPKKEETPVIKAESEKPATPDKSSKAEEKPVKEQKPVKEEKPAEEQSEEEDEEEEDGAIDVEAEEKGKPATKAYHISKRKSDGMWQIKLAGGKKAIKLFRTQQEAIDYCKVLAEKQEARITIHKKDGSFRKLTY